MVIEPELLQYYTEKVKLHNEQGPYPNSGFDLICPEVYESDKTFMVNFKVKGAMYDEDKNMPVGYFLFARSSISKTRFRLANSVGIIDSGYRGNLCAYFDVLRLTASEYLNASVANATSLYATTEPQQRLVQICAPSLEPFRIEIVDSLDQTERGEGGFGSTGL
jgi:dUTP pyrophosphatase